MHTTVALSLLKAKKTITKATISTKATDKIISVIIKFTPIHYMSIGVMRLIKIFLKSIYCIKHFPGEGNIVSAEVTVGCCLLIDGTAKVKTLDNCCRTKVELTKNNFVYCIIG